MAILSLIFFIYWIVDLILVIATRKSGSLRYPLEMIIDCAAYLGCYYWGKATDTLKTATTEQLVIVVAVYFVVKMIIKRFTKKG